MIEPQSITKEWRAVVGYEWLYEVSRCGLVRRVNNPNRHEPIYLLKQGRSKGYCTVALYRDGQRRMNRVHVLVAAAFLGERSPGMEVNHINGIKCDNRTSNLEYLTHAENMKHAASMHRNGGVCGSLQPHSKLIEEKVREMRRLREDEGWTERRLAAHFGVGQTTTHRIVIYEMWKHVH